MKLEIKDLHVSVDGKKVLNGVSVVINPGEIHAIMGPNGGGKSTLSFVIAGHPKYKVEQGDILVDGKSILGLPAHERAKRGMFLSFQNPLEVQGVSFSKFLLTIAKAKDAKLSVVDFKKRLDALLVRLGLDKSFVERDVNVGFSGGEKKRAEVLQLFIANPALAILDELDSGLDVDSLQFLGSQVNALRGQNFSALVITHYQRLLDFLKPDVVHILVDGKIVASGSADLARDVEKKGYAQLVTV